MIDVVQFVPLETIDPIYYSKAYYLEPEKSGIKPYVLLARALEESGKVAVVKVALRQREALAAVRVRDGVFVLETMLWPDEIRDADFGFMDEEVEVRPQELAMAGTLIESLSGEFDPNAFHDSYREALEQVIDAKAAGDEVVPPPARPDTGGAVVDLMAALRASVDAAKKGRVGDAKPAKKAAKPVKAAKPAARKPAAKKAPAKKAAKTATRKSA
jgi:DNA end-binding protein Ku